LAEPRHTVVVFDPGHFHAALTLREHHPRLADEVYVYAQDGLDLERFLSVVQAFNQRAEAPTHWKTHVYRGADCLERLCVDRPGDIVVVAGRNDTKMATIHRLHAAGFFVLGDKPWLIDPQQLPMLEEVATSVPIAMDIMTERHDIANRVLKALIDRPGFFGSLNSSGSEPAIHLKSVHHLCKTVNGKPLVRPAWYFDTAVQGEGITDVTTHLVDLAQWMVGGEPFHYTRDVELVSARQWRTEVPRAAFTQATGLPAFPEPLADRVSNGVLRLLCNASIDFRLRGTLVRIESIWDLAPPEGGGDTHLALVRGTGADLVIEQNAGTAFVPELLARPAQPRGATALADAIASLQSEFPGIGMRAANGAARLLIPAALRTTHEQHFARVLDRFLGYVDGREPPAGAAAGLAARYTLLARAAERARGA
jgi:predicted dehydrogenase